MLEERLRGVPLFRGLPGDRIAELSAALTPVHCTAGDVIFREGDAADALYLVDEGHVQVARRGEPVAVLGPGSFVGEMALLLDDVRSADLVAVTDVRLWTLGRAAVTRLLDEHADLALELSRHLSSRLAATTRLLTPEARATVVAVWGGARQRGRVDDLISEMERLSGTRPALVERGEPLPLTSDHIVAVLPTEQGREARAVLRRAAYVVCLDRPPGWVISRHGPARVLRCDGSLSVERAARWATGRAVGLALSSGGSKTVAHIGAVVTLREAGVAVDMLAGSSGGALVALAAGAGHSLETMVRNVRELAELLTVRRWDLNVPPRAGVLKGRRVRDAIDRWFDGRTFADLALPTVVVAADLSTGAEVVIDHGPVADAARASLSIPGVFDPWMHDGRPLVDGAVVDPLPTSVLRDRGVPVVIASNVAGKDSLDQDAALTEAPNVLQTMLRMVNLMERELLKSQLPLADVLIRPRVQANYSFDFSRIDEFVNEGRRATRETLASVRGEKGILFA